MGIATVFFYFKYVTFVVKSMLAIGLEIESPTFKPEQYIAAMPLVVNDIKIYLKWNIH